MAPRFERNVEWRTIQQEKLLISKRIDLIGKKDLTYIVFLTTVQVSRLGKAVTLF
jgi:hypothetical protein